MYGFYGKILKIDLNKEAFSIEPVDDQLLRTCLGGKGLATHTFTRTQSTASRSVDPENHLMFATGPTSEAGSGVLAIMGFIPNPLKPARAPNLIQVERSLSI